jgi:2,3-bisphosphoglycerate-dependent phosphoglycerate mutase
VSVDEAESTKGRPALLVLVRHGQSARNVVKKHNRFFLDDESRKSVQGIPDWQVPLTEEGHRQALVTGQGLRARHGVFDYVYHSGSLTRTGRQTAVW